ncbi:hypothetical protein JX265_007680 [Neoarthrinium moseri]|uniref:Uncharacterized protein n=1 Tax=Neoarthrinium moseri TaxID=1658444 RepID=A0A9Q0AMS2_9PEZI|nr:hypothetical protein JX266_000349 [Neoarthrinium moseri]KAI1866379.1 hypothetical protein JX265_007680 [Neoarthrinium moseri]
MPAPGTPQRQQPHAQMPSPPTTKRATKIVTLKLGSTNGVTKYREMFETLQCRRITKKAPKAPKTIAEVAKFHPTASIKACTVAIHPFWRGPRLDGLYHEWLDDLYDHDMPPIIRRINKFRGFPQKDDPEFNPDTYQMYKDLHATKKFDDEFGEYLPYLSKYFESVGNDFAQHSMKLDQYYQHVLKSEEGCKDFFDGSADEWITGGLAHDVHLLSVPPSASVVDGWPAEQASIPFDDYKASLEGRFQDPRTFDAVRKEAYSRIICQEVWVVDSPVSVYYEEEPTVFASGLFVSQHPDGINGQSPGLIFYHRPSVIDPEENLLTEDGIKVESPATPPMSSIPRYVSPAGELMCPQNIPDSDDVAQIRARTDIDALAAAIGYSLTSPPLGPELDHLLNIHDKEEPRLTGYPELHTPTRHQHHDDSDSDDYGPWASKEPVRALHSSLGYGSRKRKRDSNHSGRQRTCTKRRRRGRGKGKSRCKTSRDDDSDGDYAPPVQDDLDLDVQKEEKKLEALPSKLRTGTVRKSGQKQTQRDFAKDPGTVGSA